MGAFAQILSGIIFAAIAGAGMGLWSALASGDSGTNLAIDVSCGALAGAIAGAIVTSLVGPLLTAAGDAVTGAAAKLIGEGLGQVAGKLFTALWPEANGGFALVACTHLAKQIFE